MPDCLFCKIIGGQIPASHRVSGRPRWSPSRTSTRRRRCTCSWCRAATSRASTTLTAEDDGLVGEMIRRGAALAAEHGHSERGFRTVFNCNADAGQTVFHIHLHVLGGREIGVAARIASGARGQGPEAGARVPEAGGPRPEVRRDQRPRAMAAMHQHSALLLACAWHPSPLAPGTWPLTPASEPLSYARDSKYCPRPASRARKKSTARYPRAK